MFTQNQKQRVGDVRPSQMLYVYGIGATVDLPNLSAMVMGLDEWEKEDSLPINEERLLAAVRGALGAQVKELRQPPVVAEGADNLNAFDERNLIGVPVAPFPGWVVCPRCRLLAPLQKGLFEFHGNKFRPDRAAYRHALCRGAAKAPTVIPARFIAACPKGHLDDFPWQYFVHQGRAGCAGALRLQDLKRYGTPRDLIVQCESCGKKRSLIEAIGIQGADSMPGCRGRHPHLRSFDDHCDEQMQTVTLGASNAWFAVNMSVLSIPTAAGKLALLVEQNFATFKDVPTKDVFSYVYNALRSQGQLPEFSLFSIDEIWQEIERHKSKSKDDSDTETDLKTPEYKLLMAADKANNSTNFVLRPTSAPTGYEQFLVKTVLVERLREVKALVGFTRLDAPEPFDEQALESPIQQAPLSRHNLDWTLATEVRGEGIFLEFREGALTEWLTRKSAILKKFDNEGLKVHRQWREARKYSDPAANYKGLRFLLLHSFAHALMRQLALECGYAAASLSERIYSRDPEESGGAMAGVLIYTSTSDSEGTLGGLVSLGEPGQLGRHIAQALEAMEICSSDPLCAEHETSLDETTLHWAACHACLFSPETSCESGNRYLDRSILVPTMHEAERTFFL